MDREEIEFYATDTLQLLPLRREGLLNLWDQDRAEAIKELDELERDRSRSQIAQAFTAAKNAFVLSWLYFSPEVDVAVDKLTTKLGSAMAHVVLPDRKISTAYHKAVEADGALVDLRIAMQREMRRGFESLASRQESGAPADGGTVPT
jgi:hypothetical protein